MESAPKTLIEAIRYFSDLDVATAFFAKVRWPEGPFCPRCECKEYSYLKSRRLWKCRDCKYQYSVKKGSVFEDSPIGLDKWLPAVWLIANCKNGISSYELARDLGVSQKAGWFMLHRIRLAMRTGTFQKLAGEVEADESFIGGRATNMHRNRRRQRFGNADNWKGPHAGKTIVMGMKERGGKVRTHVIPSTHQSVVQRLIREAVLPGSAIYTDKMGGYRGIDAFDEYGHAVVDHAERYVDGRVHVNGLENYWSLLKRTIKGTYVAVEPDHLDRYLDEQVFRFNERHGDDSDRFTEVLGQAIGRRITWAELTSAKAAQVRRSASSSESSD